MNNVRINIIYSKTYRKAQEKIEEIIKEKNKMNIPLIAVNKNIFYIEKYIFFDETWIILYPKFHNCRGYRYKKYYIDRELSKDIINEYILPYSMYKTEEEKYF